MKLWFKRNKIWLLFLFLLFAWAMVTIANYNTDYHKTIKMCRENAEYVEQHPEIDFPFKFDCESKRLDTVTVFLELFFNSSLRIMMWVGPFIVGFCCIWNFYNDLKSGFIKNYLLRMSYRKYMLKSYFSALKGALLIPFCFFVLFIGAYLFSGHFDLSVAEKLNRLQTSFEFYAVIPKFLFCYFFNLLLIGVLYTNMALLAVKRSGHLVLAVVGGYLANMAVYLFYEIILTPILVHFFRLDSITLANSFSISLFYSYQNVFGLEFMVSFALQLAGLSTLFVYLLYRKKESMVIASES